MSQAAKWDAGLYDDKHSFVWKMGAGVIELLAPKQGEHILDVGCGTGHLTAQIAETGAIIFGTDRSPDMVRQAREKYPNLRFEVMDGRELAFPEKFDAVFSNATLHWIKEAEKVAAGISRSLRTGGRFVAEFGGRGNVHEFMKACERAWTACGLPDALPNPWYYPSIAEYAAVLENNSLEVTYALLFDRPTPLEDGERGLRNWIDMFAGSILGALPAERRERLISEIERQARPSLFHDGQWVLDYRRLRVVAKKI